MVDIASIKSGNKDDKKAAAKVVKFKLTKEQTAFVDEFVKLNNRIAVCREYIGLWTNYFRFLDEGLAKGDVTPEDEKSFFQLTTVLARKHFQFVELMGDCFDRGGDIINVLANASSMAVVQAMQEQTRAKFELDWHTLFLEMNKGLGRLLRMLPGAMTLGEALASLEKGPPAPGGKPAAAAKK